LRCGNVVGAVDPSEVRGVARFMVTNRLKIYPSHSWTDALFRVVDATCIMLGLLMAAHQVGSSLLSLLGVTAIALFFVMGELCGMYRNWRGISLEREIACGLTSWCATAVGLLLIGYATSYVHVLSPVTSAVWFFNTATLLAANRVVIRAIQHRLRTYGFNTRRYAIVGINELAFQLARNVHQAPELGLNLVGFYDDRQGDRLPETPAGFHCDHIGDLDSLVAAARRREVDLIYITFPMRAEDRIRRVLSRLADSTAGVYIVPDFFVFELLHSRWTNIGGLPAVSIFEHPFYGVDGMVKRLLDLVLAGSALVALAVPMAAIAALVKSTSPGPVLFRQRRYGLDGREIPVWKFRTMRVCEDGEHVRQARRDDDRLTPVGGLLRRTSLDELPQLFNVLLGNMSLVGPRPHATAHNEQYRTMISGYMLRHKVKPGITGLAQVNGCRGETDTLEKMRRRVEYDHRYIQDWSVWLDIKILIKTVLVVLSQDNAY
jgi:putative colanic acid biosysnthesis UDP-glucose lipid carrier transferase